MNPELSSESENRSTIPRDINLDQLMDVLVRANIPVEEYGIHAAKTVLHLLSEINEGEAHVTMNENGELLRELNVLWVDVLCELSNGDVYVLEEDRQEFKDGRVKRRNLDSSIGEKLKPDEDPQEAVERALQEELGVENAVEVLHHIGYDERTFIPDAFPGLESTYRMHKFVTVIAEDAFIPEGYIEVQADKTNYYTWRLIHPKEA